MEKTERDSGIDAIGDIPWGTHLCLFYKSGGDLSDIIVPFFEAGLRNNEFCMCVTSNPARADELKRLMESRMPDFHGYVSRGQVEFVPYSGWYLADGAFDQARVLKGWSEKLRRAKERGFDGARVTGDTLWVDKTAWKDFLDYERALDSAFAGRNVIALCTYSLDRCGASEVIDVASIHQFALSRRDGRWSVIENVGLKGMRKALMESEKKFRALAEASPAAIAVYRGNRFLYVNHAAVSIYGYTREELMKMDIPRLLHPGNRDRIMCRLEARLHGAMEIERYMARIITGGGAEKWLDVSCRLINYGGASAGLAISMDITDRIEAEVKYSRLLSTMPGGFWISDSEGRFLEANDACCRILGYARDELLSMSIQDVEAIESPEGVLGRIRSLRQKTCDRFESRHRRKDGSIIDVEVNASYLDIGGGNVVVLFSDITGRKRAEEDKNRLLHDLGERVKELKALHGVYDIVQKERLMPEALQEVANALPPAWQYPEVASARILFDGREYKTPDFRVSPWSQRAEFHTSGGKSGAIEVYYLEKRQDEAEGPFLKEERALINLLAEMLRVYLDKWYAEEALKEAKVQAELYLDIMGHDISNMHQIAMGYIELARDMQADIGRAELLDKPVEVLQRSSLLIQNVRKLQMHHDGAFPAKPIDVCEVLSRVYGEFGGNSNKKVTLNMNGIESCRIQANELLYDVFSNLVSNAIKHAGDKTGIAVSLNIVKDDEIRYCQVAVEDNGPGIPDEFKERIFNRVLRGTDHSKGMGLGLYLVKSLVDSYGGRVWVEDRVAGDHAKGSKFVVTLPAIEK